MDLAIHSKTIYFRNDSSRLQVLSSHAGAAAGSGIYLTDSAQKASASACVSHDINMYYMYIYIYDIFIVLCHIVNIYVYAFFRAKEKVSVFRFWNFVCFSFLLKLPSNLSHDFFPVASASNPGRQIVAANHMPMAAARCWSAECVWGVSSTNPKDDIAFRSVVFWDCFAEAETIGKLSWFWFCWFAVNLKLILSIGRLVDTAISHPTDRGMMGNWLGLRRVALWPWYCSSTIWEHIYRCFIVILCRSKSSTVVDITAIESNSRQIAPMSQENPSPQMVLNRSFAWFLPPRTTSHNNL